MHAPDQPAARMDGTTTLKETKPNKARKSRKGLGGKKTERMLNGRRPKNG